MSEFIQAPDLLIYLRADVTTLVGQIQKRGREYESSIRLDYLQHLNELMKSGLRRTMPAK